MNLRIGDIVKSLDFVGSDDCYMVGKVVGVFASTGEFRATFIKRVWRGVEDKKSNPDYFSAPLQGEMLMDCEDQPRIVVIG